MASELEVTTIRGLSSGADANKIIVPSGQTLQAPGHVINVTQVVKTDVQSTTNFTFVDISGLSITVNPVSTSSKFLINFLVRGASNYFTSYVRLLRDSTELGANADGAGDSRLRIASAKVTDQTISNAHGIVHDHNFQFLDEPNTTSATTYKLQMAGRGSGAGHIMYVNRSIADRTSTEYDMRAISLMQVYEIG